MCEGSEAGWDGLAGLGVPGEELPRCGVLSRDQGLHGEDFVPQGRRKRRGGERGRETSAVVQAGGGAARPEWGLQGGRCSGSGVAVLKEPIEFAEHGCRCEKEGRGARQGFIWKGSGAPSRPQESG